MIIKNHVIAGVSGDDMDNPGYLDAYDPVTGERQWRWFAVPQKMDEPGSDTWPDVETMKNGGGMTWTPVTYDPTLNLLYVTTGNPQPVIAHKNRAGANLFTGSIVALNADTGKMVWYFQSSPHDTHDWDSTQAAVIIDGEIDGQPRKLIAQAARNGHFFVLDRTNGKAIVSTEYVKTNWSLGYDAKGQPIPNPAKIRRSPARWCRPNQGGATNWQSPSFSPLTGLFYVQLPPRLQRRITSTIRATIRRAGAARIAAATRSTMLRRSTTGQARSGGRTRGNGGRLRGALHGRQRAVHRRRRAASRHSTRQPARRCGTRASAASTNAPITYELDGFQYVTVAAGTLVVSLCLNR